ncbi:disease resistance protein RGA5-like [Miscanthus floridulus]|uniref:disease resistance protein RGA5-like n=1 Tax=Miscanthus floridulus TaxID=154761 RepID=UPI00345AFD7E
MIKNGAQIRSINIFGSNSVLVNKHATEFLNSQVLRVLNIEGEVGECFLGNIKSLGQLKFLRIDNKFSASKIPEDIEKLQRLETLNVRWQCLEKLPASIIQLQKLVRLLVHESVRLPDGIGSLQALEELSRINLGIQSVKCISMLSRLFRHLRELRVWQSDPDATCSFMASCVPTSPPLRQLVLNTRDLNRVGPQISSLVNLTRLRIRVSGEAGNEGINILASLPMLLSLTVGLLNDKNGDSGILYARHAISRQGFQRLVKFHLRCWREAAVEFEPGAMPMLQRLKLELMARCQFKFREDEVEALEDDIRGAAAVHPNRPILQIQRIRQDWMAQGCSRRPSDHAIVEA